MFPNTQATILFHQHDGRVAEELAAQLRSMNRQLDIVLDDLSVRVPIPSGERRAVLLLLTAALLGQLGAKELEELLASWSAHDHAPLVLVNKVRQANSIVGLKETVDISGFDMAHLPDELTRIGTYIMNAGAPEPITAKRLVLGGHDPSLMRALLGRVEALPLSTRTRVLLHQDNIIHVGDLVMRTEAELLRMPGLGRATLLDVRQALSGVGLRLGMEVPDWPPANIEETLARLDIAERVGQLRQSKGGARFEPRGDRLAMVTEGDVDDRSAASRQMTRQMQEAVLDKARSFDAAAARLDNQLGWTGIARTSSTLVSLLDRPSEEIPDVLGYLYPVTLELGSYLELDAQLTGGNSYAEPLDAEVRRPLTDLVRTLAPWLRSFPSIREADDEASRFLLEVGALQPAKAVVDAAERHEVLAISDIEVFRQLEQAAERGAFQGGKAGGRTQRSASNLVISAVAFAGTFLAGAVSSDYATTSPLVHKVGQFLTHTEVEIFKLVESAAPDLRHAIRGIVERVGSEALPPSSPSLRRTETDLRSRHP